MIKPLHTEIQRIDNVFKLAKQLEADDEVLAHWARYLCVLSSGLVESGLRHMLSDYVRKGSSPNVSKFAMKHIDNLTNINSNKLAEILGAFDDNWRAAFDTDISDAQRSAIDSIVANRHNIAHGRHVGISMVRMQTYYNDARDVLDWVHKLLFGNV